METAEAADLRAMGEDVARANREVLLAMGWRIIAPTSHNDCYLLYRPNGSCAGHHPDAVGVWYYAPNLTDPAQVGPLLNFLCQGMRCDVTNEYRQPLRAWRVVAPWSDTDFLVEYWADTNGEAEKALLWAAHAALRAREEGRG